MLCISICSSLNFSNPETLDKQKRCTLVWSIVSSDQLCSQDQVIEYSRVDLRRSNSWSRSTLPRPAARWHAGSVRRRSATISGHSRAPYRQQGAVVCCDNSCWTITGWTGLRALVFCQNNGRYYRDPFVYLRDQKTGTWTEHWARDRNPRSISASLGRELQRLLFEPVIKHWYPYRT